MAAHGATSGKGASAEAGGLLPLVVQVGFAGSRRLLDADEHPDIDLATFEAEIERQLAEHLDRLVADLSLEGRHFPCGISQIAIGADTLFTRVCRDRAIAQRIFLPQPRDEYLRAEGSAGPDFTEEQRAIALDLLASPHIIQERVVSDAPDRRDRLHDTSLEILRASDVVVCLVRPSPSDKPGGTNQLIELARKHRRPVLEIQVEVREGHPVLNPHWHGRESFRPPQVPPAIDRARLDPTPAQGSTQIERYCGSLKALTSREANWQRRLFQWAALIIIGTHVLATVLAVLALRLHGSFVTGLLALELALLACGFLVHQYLHHAHSLETWALSRLTAEVARSVGAIGRFHLELEYLFTLPFPDVLRPLLRTLNVRHLQSTRQADITAWDAERDAYIRKRLLLPRNGQIDYHKRTMSKARVGLRAARWTFLTASLLAIVATLLKLLITGHWVPWDHALEETSTAILGGLAVVLPVLAVAALSLAAAFDQEARYHTSKEMLEFLLVQTDLLKSAGSPREFSRLLLETESRLLGETANWYARRAFVGVA
jgi:hypothetical protein